MPAFASVVAPLTNTLMGSIPARFSGLGSAINNAIASNPLVLNKEFETQAQAFEAAGALLDLTDKKADLGGDSAEPAGAEHVGGGEIVAHSIGEANDPQPRLFGEATDDTRIHLGSIHRGLQVR